MELSRKTMKKLALLIAFAALAFTAFEWFDGAARAAVFLLDLLAPFLAGGAVAFVLNVPMRFIESKLLPTPGGKPTASRRVRRFLRPVSLLLTFLFVVLVILVLVLVIAPELVRTVAGLGVTIQNAVLRFLNWAEEMFANTPQVMEWLNSLTFNWQSINWQSLINQVVDVVKSGATSILSSAFSTAMNVFNGVADTFIAFFFACYLLLQKEKLGLQCRKALYALLPRKGADQVVEVFSLSHRIFSSFITGQCTEAVILGTMFFIVMSILNMPYAVLVGCTIAVTALIPIVGAFIGCGLGAFLLLMVSPMQALIFVAMFLILQQVEGNLIYPHVVGSSVGLPSIWVLAAVSIGGSLMGVAGMLLFIPMTSVIYTLFRQFVYRRLREKNLRIHASGVEERRVPPTKAERETDPGQGYPPPPPR